MGSVGARVGRRTALAAGLAATWLLADGSATGAGVDLDGKALAAQQRRLHNDVLFIGAHPDDEAANLSTFGQWHENLSMTTGVVTITRGEGGGNATGLAEGPQLGLIREVEERRATAAAGVKNVYYLDKPDFWYTLSAPLTARIWDMRDTLAKVVWLVRATTPETVVVMNPRPFNQHGGHQVSARAGIEAFRMAGDPLAFPEQLTSVQPWRPQRLLAQNFGFRTLLGPAAPTQQHTDPDTGLPVIGVWSGVRSQVHEATWAQIQRDAGRAYLTQGAIGLGGQLPADPTQLGSDWFTALADNGRIIAAPVTRQHNLRPLYAEFQAWADRIGMPWLANGAQPDYPARPKTMVPAVPVAPVLNGAAGPGEYPGPELPLAVWMGDDRTTATAKVSRHDDDLYVLVTVNDRRKGAALERNDVKRHWRTDSVEIAIDPRGDSDDTSTTLKLGILPYTAHDGGPGAERDADNHQGPVPETAPGIRIAATVTDPYRGYTVEAKIPLAALPAPVDPTKFAMNILVYNSDTDDKIGQTRLAWSPFGSAQADPYVWGTATLTDYRPPDSKRPPTPPLIPEIPARSTDSPPSIAQAKRLGIAVIS